MYPGGGGGGVTRSDQVGREGDLSHDALHLTTPPPSWTDRCLWKHNFHSLRYGGGKNGFNVVPWAKGWALTLMLSVQASWRLTYAFVSAFHEHVKFLWVTSRKCKYLVWTTPLFAIAPFLENAWADGTCEHNLIARLYQASASTLRQWCNDACDFVLIENNWVT